MLLPTRFAEEASWGFLILGLASLPLHTCKGVPGIYQHAFGYYSMSKRSLETHTVTLEDDTQIACTWLAEATASFIMSRRLVPMSPCIGSTRCNLSGWQFA